MLIVITLGNRITNKVLFSRFISKFFILHNEYALYFYSEYGKIEVLSIVSREITLGSPVTLTRRVIVFVSWHPGPGRSSKHKNSWQGGAVRRARDDGSRVLSIALCHLLASLISQPPGPQLSSSVK